MVSSEPVDAAATPAGTALGNMTNSEFPRDAEGRVYHFAVKEGEVANRVITVGDEKRAAMIASFMDGGWSNRIISPRGFHVYTGTFEGTPVTVVGSGMGFPNMDMMVRELTAVTEGPMAFIRFGTCGTPSDEANLGDVVVASEYAVSISRNVDAYIRARRGETVADEDFYIFHEPEKPSPELCNSLTKELERAFADYTPAHVQGDKGCVGVRNGCGATADTFYDCQGRMSPFGDRAIDQLIPRLLKLHPTLSSLEMETYWLYHLCNSSARTLYCGGAALAIAHRGQGSFLPKNEIVERMSTAAPALLRGICNFPLPEDQILKNGVWDERPL